MSMSTGTLVPALGFVNVYPFVFSYVADHFQYLASAAMIAFLVATGTRGVEQLSWRKGSSTALAVGVLLILGGLTWRQSQMYRDVFALYETTLARNPSSWIAHLNLGTALDDTGRTDEALPHLQRANELKPDTPETLNSLATRQAVPRGPTEFELHWTFFGYEDDSPEMTAPRVRILVAPIGLEPFPESVASRPG